MAELEFERRLERLFAEAPELPDSTAFAKAVEKKLDRGWRARRWLIGAAGVGGGVIAANQLLMSNLFQHVESAEGSARLISSGVSRMAPRVEWLSALSSVGGMVWVAAGLAVLAMGFALTRMIGEI